MSGGAALGETFLGNASLWYVADIFKTTQNYTCIVAMSNLPFKKLIIIKFVYICVSMRK